MRLYFDTSVLVSLAVAHHPHHQPAYAIFQQMTADDHQGFVSAHGLAETFATLTRLPITPMFHPTEAYRIVAETIVGRCEVVCLDQADYLATLQAAANSGLRGGIIYDALHVRCAEKARCDRIYTFNIPDFLRVAPQIGKQILRP
ncbi:MAG: PIN domain-containing protein [Terriglobales bacterium]